MSFSDLPSIFNPKSCPTTRRDGAWEERRYSSYSFTSALDGDEWSASRPGRALPPEKGPPVPAVQEAGWAPDPVWTQRLQEKSFRLSNLDRSVVQPLARHYTARATGSPIFNLLSFKNERKAYEITNLSVRTCVLRTNKFWNNW
jgi:hypothetical protein